jgi:hypothetical protein
MRPLRQWPASARRRSPGNRERRSDHHRGLGEHAQLARPGHLCRKDGSYILYNYSGGFSWYLYGPDNRLQHDIAGTLGNGAWGYIVGTYDKDAGPENQRLYLNGSRVAQMSDTAAISLNSNPLGIGRHASGIADPFNGHIDEFRISHVQRSDGWIATTWNNLSNPGAFAVAGAEEQEGGEPPQLAGAGVVVCLMG